MITVDLKSGYHHVWIHPDHTKYLGFQWRGKFYEFLCLPFGLSAAPWAFTKIVRVVLTHWRTLGNRINGYIDDFLLMIQRQLQPSQTAMQFVALLIRLGWTINYAKSALTPAQTQEYIGYYLDCVNQPTIRMTYTKLKNLRSLVRSVLNVQAKKGCVFPRTLAKTLGSCIATARAILPAKLMLRSGYADLASKTSWTTPIKLSPQTVSDLTWWMQSLTTWNGQLANLNRVTQLQMETDASVTGWGAAIGGLHASGFWEPEWAPCHINVKEMIAVFYAILSFQEQLQNKVVSLRTDSLTVVAYLNNMGGPVSHLQEIARAIFNLSWTINCTLVVSYIPGRFNVRADRLSRLSDSQDWMINPIVFIILDKKWGPHHVDRFATMLNSQLPVYNSRFHDPATSGVDAMTKCWRLFNNWISAPFRMLPAIINKLRNENALATVIAPIWPSQPWFLLLLEITADVVMLPNQPDTFLPGASENVEPLRNPSWKLAAGRLARPGGTRRMELGDLYIS
eukprot:Lithocolla_globosa_v1_NODE_442_length_4041_cov_30.407677.p2 type:complete len:509 gc:universal NODE_442_length_4041_cov_30.407677:2679-1153(-)